MLLYSSDFLKIHLEHQYERCILEWLASPTSVELFKEDIKQYTEIALTFHTKQALWLQQKLDVKMDNDLIMWLEENMNKPIIENILKDNFYPLDCNQNYPVALVLGQKEYNLLQLSRLTNGRDKSMTIEKMPRFFDNEKDARAWLDKWRSFQEVELESLVLKTENPISQSERVTEVLTKREKEIVQYKLQGKAPKEIADLMNISINTVRTHWKNIKKKINVKSSINVVGD
ncbi:LuxR C-terminal-related transcriptional regulator [Flammeovirga aprica]|uniref:Response regulator transcription factor n=1 Tax=Flammeovirga aprica JL-4 TaxID=694437 RepID=A0A7X9RVB9_9BACT|nr:LuxR C-terminal-related transcriptional regulator [Flammeovirga aprica]NME69368.1 response regulator transcription factor [Flammeovirga aprica JL-4]